MPALADLPDHARVQALPCDPSLTSAQAGDLIAAISKLFTQFVKENRIERWAIEPAAGGALLVIAWHGTEDLSGCSKDKLAQVLAAHEERTRSRLLAAPPIVIEVGGVARCVDRAGLRALAAQGVVGADTPVYDTRLEHLGDWRARSRIPARDCWIGRLI